MKISEKYSKYADDKEWEKFISDHTAKLARDERRWKRFYEATLPSFKKHMEESAVRDDLRFALGNTLGPKWLEGEQVHVDNLFVLSDGEVNKYQNHGQTVISLKNLGMDTITYAMPDFLIDLDAINRAANGNGTAPKYAWFKTQRNDRMEIVVSSKKPGGIAQNVIALRQGEIAEGLFISIRWFQNDKKSPQYEPTLHFLGRPS